jgi:hypothetical protein
MSFVNKQIEAQLASPKKNHSVDWQPISLDSQNNSDVENTEDTLKSNDSDCQALNNSGLIYLEES